MFAIYKREMRSYFTTPLGYIYAAVYLAISGFLFAYTTFQAATTDVSSFTQMMIFGYVLLIPLLTMKSFAEEKKQRTEQVLLSAPVSVFGIVFAKFTAAYTMFASTAVVGCLYFIPVAVMGSVNTAKTVGCFIAILLIGLCFTAIGVFVSTLTENQMTASILTVTVLLVFVCASLFNSLIDSTVIRTVLSWVSVYSRVTYFTYGIFDFSALVYYLSLTGIFLFLAVRVCDRRRWA